MRRIGSALLLGVHTAAGPVFTDFLTLHSLNEFAQGSFGNILAGKGRNAPIHGNRFVQIESSLPRILARRFDLSTFGVTALLFWSGKSGVAIGDRITPLIDRLARNQSNRQHRFMFT